MQRSASPGAINLSILRQAAGGGEDIAWHARRYCITIIKLRWHAPEYSWSFFQPFRCKKNNEYEITRSESICLFGKLGARLDCYELSGVDISGTGIDFIPSQTKSNTLNLCCSWANTVGRIAPSDMYLHARRLCKIHHNRLAAPPAPKCYVRIYQNACDMTSFHSRQRSKGGIQSYFIHNVPIGLPILHLETMHTMTKQALYILWQFQLEECHLVAAPISVASS